MLEPGKTLGPFRIEKELGSGAMGTVFKAVFAETGQPVALKWIAVNLSANETALARFEREAAILKQLNHPNIVRLFANGHYKKMPFFAMEYVKGESLDKMLERRGRLGWQEVVRFSKQLCAALKHAHEKGIIHRDLKPSNLMILNDGTLKLTDFGIAKDVDVTSLTGANVTVGTAAYMSPEQCHGERNLTAKSDLYSLGIVMYELLTGEKPFKKETPIEMFLAHVNDPFERPSRLAMDIPHWLDTLVCHLMEKKPEQRPFDAAMVAKVLDEVEEKVAEQRSVGMEVVAGGKPSRIAAADEKDKEVARQLRVGSKKKKLRIRSKPFYEQKWFTAASISLVIVGLVGLTWWLTRPPSAEKLFQQASAAMKVGDKDTALDIARQYQEYYANYTDQNAIQMRAWIEELTVDQDEKAMHKRFQKQLTPDGDAQKIVYSALHFENDGNVIDARQRWEELQKNYEPSPDPKERAWAWLAKRKIKALDNLKHFENQLTEYRQNPDHKLASDAELQAFEALRFEKFGDLPAAVSQWSKLKDKQIKEFDQRIYVLLAASKIRTLQPQAVSETDKIRAFRKELIQQRLDEVDQRLKEMAKQSSPSPALIREATNRCQDIVDLYSKDPDPELAPLVKSASDKLKEIKR